MRASRGLGAINPSKMPKGKTKKLADGGFLEIEAMQPEGPTSEGMPDSSMRRNIETGEYYSTENLEPPKRAVRSAPKAPEIKDVPGRRSTAADIRKADIAAEERFLQERQKRLSTPGADAIESVFPESVLIGGAPMAALKGLRGAATAAPQAVRAAVRELELMTRPKVNNFLAPDLLRAGKAGATEGKYAVRNLINREKGLQEIEDIKRTGYMMPSPKEVQSGRNRKWFTQTDEPNKAHLRVLAEKVPPNRAVRRKDIEIYDPVKGDYVPLKKGGKVSDSSRADGIAQRGKTRGRMY